MKIGDQVIHKTKESWELNLGSGIIVGEEFNGEPRLHRWLVLLDEPSKWTCSTISKNTAAFFDCDLGIFNENRI